MKAEELMIGDWVLWKNKPVQIAEISGIKYSFGHIDVVLAHCNDDNLLESHDIKSIEPIPITPSILEKNGFMEYRYRQGDWFFVIENKENETLAIVSYGTSHRLEIESWDDLIGSFERGGIKYIHQLQQAMRLCGISKEI